VSDLVPDERIEIKRQKPGPALVNLSDSSDVAVISMLFLIPSFSSGVPGRFPSSSSMRRSA
jgi:hypothetical protein